jgi:hypothetical protein
MTTHTTPHVGTWIVDEYSRAVGKGRDRRRIQRALIIEENGTEDGILIADNLSVAVAEHIVRLHNKYWDKI